MDLDLSKPIPFTKDKFEQALAAAKGDADKNLKPDINAIVLVAEIIAEGYNLHQVNNVEALSWLEKGITLLGTDQTQQNDLCIAQHALLIASSAGVKGGAAFGKLKLQRISDWLLQEAKAGHIRAQRILGTMYSKGLGVTKNYDTAIEWLSLADKAGDAPSSHELGNIAATRDDGFPVDVAGAAQHYRHAAEMGHANAQYELGRILVGTTGQLDAGIEQLHLSAQQGRAFAQRLLASTIAQYHPEQPELAAEWYEAAAQQGFPSALFEIARRYELGKITPATLPADAPEHLKELSRRYPHGGGVEQNLPVALKIYTELLSRPTDGNTLETVPLDDKSSPVAQAARKRLQEQARIHRYLLDDEIATYGGEQLAVGERLFVFKDGSNIRIPLEDKPIDTISRAKGHMTGNGHVKNFAEAYAICQELLAMKPAISKLQRTDVLAMQDELNEGVANEKTTDGIRIKRFSDGTILALIAKKYDKKPKRPANDITPSGNGNSNEGGPNG